jgi:hypothetical protein
VRLAVLGVADEDGAVLQVHLVPNEAGGFLAPEPGVKQKDQVVGDGVGVTLDTVAGGIDRRVPGGQCSALDDVAAPLGAEPGTGLGQPQDRIFVEDRSANAVFIVGDGEIEEGAQEAQGQVGIGSPPPGLAPLVMQFDHHRLGDFHHRPLLPVVESDLDDPPVVVQGAGLDGRRRAKSAKTCSRVRARIRLRSRSAIGLVLRASWPMNFKACLRAWSQVISP